MNTEKYVVTMNDDKMERFEFTEKEANEFLMNLKKEKFIELSKDFWVNTSSIACFYKVIEQ